MQNILQTALNAVKSNTGEVKIFYSNGTNSMHVVLGLLFRGADMDDLWK